MLADIEALRSLPNPHRLSVGVVLGATTGSTLDVALLRRLVSAAGQMPVTAHKAFDEVADQFAALEDLVSLGVDAVLTSGAAPTALEGAARLAELQARADGRIQVMAGGGIRRHNVHQILAATGVSAIHTSAVDVMADQNTSC